MLTREERDPETPESIMDVTLSGDELNRFPINVNFQGKLLNRVIVEVGGLVIPNPGLLRVSILIDGQESGWWEIEAVQTEKPKVQRVEQG